VSTAPTQNGGVPANNQPQSNLAAAWDTVYGNGFYVAHVLGQRIRIQGVIPCDQGTILNVQAYQYSGGDDKNPTLIRQGVATDNKGNIYKLAF
jgi:hypothetical protein